LGFQALSLFLQKLFQMFFILSKVLLFLINPLSWIVALLILALISKKPKRAKRLLFGAFATLILFTNTFFYKEICRQWEVFTPTSELKKHYDVAVVLTGMAEYNNDLKTLSVRRGIDRLWQTISLYKKGRIDRIIISGDNGDLIDKGLHESKQLKEILMLWGIPEQAIITEEKSRNTYENAVESTKIIKRLFPNSEKILLVTSGRHMRRSKASFLKQGLVFDTYSTDLYTGPKRSYTFDEFIVPDSSTLEDWHRLLKEMVGYMAYALTGKI
jgi:uncharacterized SAM-binding protein YcdF (DUF218 family)